MMKPDQERVRSVLVESIAIMCQKGLNFSCELKLQGVIGITVDYNDSFVVHINQTIDAASNSNITSNTPIKQESHQSTFGNDHSRQAYTGPVKSEAPDFMNPSSIKVEANPNFFLPGGRHPNQPVNRQAAPAPQNQQRNLQVALVSANRGQPRPSMQPANRGMARGIPQMKSRMMSPQQQQQQFYQQQVGQEQYKQEQDFFQSPSTSFQQSPASRGRGGARGGQKGNQTPKKKPAKVKQNMQFSDPQQFRGQDEMMMYAGEDDGGYEDEEYGDGQYMQPQMNAKTTKRPRGGGAAQSRGGSGPKKMKGAGGQPRGYATSDSDGTFRTISSYVCDIDNCNASFTMKCNLKRHQKTKHFGGAGGANDDDMYEDEEEDYEDGGEYY